MFSSRKRIVFSGFNNIARRNYAKSVKSDKWQSVVGLEVHAQINSLSKLFSASSTKFSSPVNSNVSLFDCSIPGTLPVLNKRCVEAGVLTALALNCQINPISSFDRKHYFYADLPTGYQITQQRAPLAVDGSLKFQVHDLKFHKNPYETEVKIKQLQLEQDSGKSLHELNKSLLDLNRAGIPLMELVFDPDLKDGEEAASLINELIGILQKIETCSCKMEEGALRVDANISVNKKGEPLGVRTEVKNIGSVRGVADAIHFEIERQIAVKESGGAVLNETRAWDSIKKVTVPMRDKEMQQDYRYMPEPNLPPLHISVGPIQTGCVSAEELKRLLPELPSQTRQRLKEKFGLPMNYCIILVNDFCLLKIFEEALSTSNIDAKLLSNILINDLYSVLNKTNLDSRDIKCTADYFSEIVELLQSGQVNRLTVKTLLEHIVDGDMTWPTKIVHEKNLWQITDEHKLRKLCQEVIDENEQAVKAYKSGKIKVLKALLGSIVKKSNRADMRKCDAILKDLLSK